MSDVFRILNLASVEALCLLRQKALRLVDESRNLYLGRWERVEIDKSHFASIADGQVLAPMSFEIISAFQDMSDHLHYHADSDAVITVLGADEGFEDPVGCTVLYKGVSFAACAGITLQVPRNTVHSFSGGATPVTFLSMQSSRIDEDYHVAEAGP
ncbi:MAG: hypothetical protein IPJ21_14995 [Sterolibacteriaceae bacterium]|nr:hypothetical protein [Sterolibacteriaceae bacterium]MBK9085085.1 hypothetical protein [Sterolibacteriaceae bacterium]